MRGEIISIHVRWDYLNSGKWDYSEIHESEIIWIHASWDYEWNSCIRWDIFRFMQGEIRTYNWFM